MRRWGIGVAALLLLGGCAKESPESDVSMEISGPVTGRDRPNAWDSIYNFDSIFRLPDSTWIDYEVPSDTANASGNDP